MVIRSSKVFREKFTWIKRYVEIFVCNEETRTIEKSEKHTIETLEMKFLDKNRF